jgi:pilus assembly protein CpaB
MAAKRYSIIFYAAIIVALISTFGVYRVLEVTKASARVATAPVVIAQKDMAEGSSIERMAVVVAQWPVGTIPAGAYTNIDSVAGRVTRVAVFKGEALVPGRLAPDGTGPGLEVKITPGKRAMSFRINDVSGIAGLIQANSRVDILVVIDGGEKGRLAKLFMENMRVLAIGSISQRSDDGRPINAAVATVEVTPEEGEKLAIATTQGSIQLMLRGYGDPDSAKTNGATTAQIVQGLNRATTVAQAPAPARAEPRRAPARQAPAPQPTPQPLVQLPPPPVRPKPDTNTVTVIRGREVSQQKFADSAKADSLRRKGNP